MLKSFQYKKNEYDRIPLMLVLLGYEHNQEPVYRTHGVPMYQVLYCKKGQGELLVDNRKYVIDKGQCFVIQKGVPHEYHSTSDEWIVNIVGFNGAIVPTLLRSLKLDSSGAYLLKGNGNFNSHIEHLLEIESTKRVHKNTELSQELYCLLTDLSNEITQIKSNTADYGNPTITQVIEYIESNYAEDIPLEKLAEITSRTPEYLCNVFKKNTGLTIVKYINNMRLLHASIMLIQDPSVPIVEVSKACGFRSPSYFGKLFTKQYRVSPQQYRLKNIL